MVGPVRVIHQANKFDPTMQELVDRYVLYRRSIGTINQALGRTWLIMNESRAPIDLPMRTPISQVGLQNLQLVDIHVIYAATGKIPAPGERSVTRTLAKLSPPGCIQVCFIHKGKMRFEGLDRVIEMTRNGGLDNGDLTIPAGEPHWDWVQPGVPYTLYEVYLICPVDGFPIEKGRLLIQDLALQMAPA